MRYVASRAWLAEVASAVAASTASIRTANDSYRLNLQRISAAEGLPIELLQAIRARSDALDAYNKAVSNYNRAQFRLLHALG